MLSTNSFIYIFSPKYHTFEDKDCEIKEFFFKSIFSNFILNYIILHLEFYVFHLIWSNVITFTTNPNNANNYYYYY